VNNMSSAKHSLLEETKIVKASSRFDSLRTTIPRSVVNLLKLEEGDSVVWDLKVIDGKNHIFVERSAQKKK
jgi:antitoxin component of MazEF toxin-antitoxin module